MRAWPIGYQFTRETGFITRSKLFKVNPHETLSFIHLVVSLDPALRLENQRLFEGQTAKPPAPANLPRGERGWGRGNAIRQGWCGPQAQPRTRPGLIGLLEGEGRALNLLSLGSDAVGAPPVSGASAFGVTEPREIDAYLNATEGNPI
ncbi:hypothetical protein TW80_09140 [Loktanella sp. S4079]|nr:hypothetical protein TW80_09140 [Loktanella sp. S4079]